MTSQPRRLVLDGVPRVGFYFDMQQHADAKARCPEDVCFPSVIRACPEYLGGTWYVCRTCQA